MARVATSGWVTGSVTPSRLRLYHVLFMVLAALLAIAIAAPSVLTQPVLYRAVATVQFNPNVFPDVAKADASGKSPLVGMQEQLGEVLSDRYEGLGSRQKGLRYEDGGAGTVRVVAFTPSVGEAVALANEAAAGLSRRIYAAAGASLLRDLLGQQFQASLEGHPTRSREEALLRRLILTGAIYGEITPSAGNRSLADLQPEERGNITRALEVQEELTLLAQQRAAQKIAHGGSAAELADAQAERKGASDALIAVRLMLTHLYDTYNTALDDPALVAAAATGASEMPAYTLAKLLLAGLIGLLGAGVTVRLDRTVGIATKFAELWAYRELMRNMVVRDLKARYKNSLLGYFWSLLNPLMTMLIFWLVFSVLLRNDIPMFPVFLIVALLPWNFAVTAVSGGMRSVLDNANLVKNVLALPVMFLVMGAVQLSSLHHLQFSWTFAFLPVILAIQVIFLIGVALLLSTVAVFFRDTTHIIDILIQLWIFLTPVFYSLEAVTRGNATVARAIRWLNPMASLVDFYRDVLYGQATNPVPGLPALDGVFRTLLTALVILAIGAFVFHRNSARFGEEL